MQVSPAEAGAAALDVIPAFGGIVRGGKYFARSVRPTGTYFMGETAYAPVPRSAEDLVRYTNVLDNPPSGVRMFSGDPAGALKHPQIRDRTGLSVSELAFRGINPADVPVAKVTFVDPSGRLPNILETQPGTFAAGLHFSDLAALPEGGVLKAARPDQLFLGYKYAMPTQPEGGLMALANPLEPEELVRTARDIVSIRTRGESALFNLKAASEGLPVAMVNPGTAVNVGTSEASILASATSAKFARDVAEKYPSMHGSIVEDYSRELYSTLKDVPVSNMSEIPISKEATLKDLFDKGARLASISAEVRNEVAPILMSRSAGRALRDAARAAGTDVRGYARQIGRMVESYARSFDEFDRLLKSIDPNYVRTHAPPHVREGFESFYREFIRSVNIRGRK